MDNNSPEGPKSPEPDSTIPVRVLIVEDDPSFEMLARITLEGDPKVTPEFCTNAEDALKLLREAKNQRLFDLVISDLGLPGGMNGIELARVIQEESLTRRFTLFTGSAYEVTKGKSREQLKEQGIDNVLGKPDVVKPFLNEIRQTRILKQGQSGNPQT